jgi:hypothetical protein
MLLTGYWSRIEQLNPTRIFVENVRSLFKISRLEARTLCEMAVNDKLFEKRVGFLCPASCCNGRMLADFKFGEEIPETLSCHICEAEENETFEYKTQDLQKVEFYRLK